MSDTRANMRKTRQLGMPFGTAVYHLRKIIMFHLVQRCGMDNCFRCGKKIETVRDLSIEHKIPWLDNNTELFWDIDNISFSHLHCNSSCSNRDKAFVALQKRGPQGTSWCNSCKTFRDEKLFWKNKSRMSGLQNRCKECIRREK